MGLTADIGAAIAVPAAVTLLSAVLAIAAMRRDARQAQPSCSDDRARPGLWARWAARIARSRWLEGPATAILRHSPAATRRGACGWATARTLAATCDGTTTAWIALALGRDRGGNRQEARKQRDGDDLSGHRNGHILWIRRA